MTDRRTFLKMLSLPAIVAVAPASIQLAAGAPELRTLRDLAEHVRYALGAEKGVAETFDFGFSEGIGIQMPDQRRHGFRWKANPHQFDRLTPAQRLKVADKVIEAARQAFA